MNIYLREIQRADISFINRWRNDKNIVNFLGAPFRFINIETDEKWFEFYLSSRNNNLRLAICETENNKLLGVVYLLQIDWINRSAEYAIQIGETSYQGGGVGLQATIKILEHAFIDLNLNRIHLTVLSCNNRALKLYNKIGFVEEGLLRKAVFKNGEYLDLIQMAIMAEEFKAIKQPDPTKTIE
jgi:UDP-4-amino-4,6-dideoxy-N-acetyl-beta-L-altrosamine N-acetyltransferase